MPNDNYRRGRAFEYYVIKKLTDRGFFCVRSAGSHTITDIVAFKEDEMLLIQLKSSCKDKEPDVKQLLKPICFDKNDAVISSNVKLLEELKVPLLLDNTCINQKETRKIILWKGIGRNNIFHFEYLNNKWVNVLNHLFKEIKCIN